MRKALKTLFPPKRERRKKESSTADPEKKKKESNGEKNTAREEAGESWLSRGKKISPRGFHGLDD